MIDTVRIHVHPAGSWPELVPSGWKSRVSTIEESDREGDFRVCQLWEHEATGTRLLGGYEPHFVEASLPRLIYPNNGHLIKDQADLDRSLSALHDLVASVCPPSRRCPSFKLLQECTRVDPVWQFPGHPADWIASLRHSKHPKVRKGTCEFFGSSLTWPGRECRIRLYDKGLEQGTPGAEIVRLEFQLRGKCLRQCFGARRDPAVLVENLSSASLHRAFRKLAQGFDPQEIVAPTCWPEFLAYMEREKMVDSAGRSGFQIYQSGHSKASIYRMKKKMEEVQAFNSWRPVFSDLIPADTWPPAVDLAA